MQVSRQGIETDKDVETEYATLTSAEEQQEKKETVETTDASAYSAALKQEDQAAETDSDRKRTRMNSSNSQQYRMPS